MSTYDNAVAEARALFGDSKALKGSTTVVVMQASSDSEYFAVRGSRLDQLKSEGFLHIASLDQSGKITEEPR